MTKHSDKLSEFRNQVAGRLVEMLRAGTAPFQRRWDGGSMGVIPLNPSTGKRYRGINVFRLMGEGRSDNRWMTYRQAQGMGAQVRKGERSTRVLYWKFRDERVKRDADGKVVRDDQGRPIKEWVELERPHAFWASVFCADQIDGLPPQMVPSYSWDPVERAEGILVASGANITHSPGGRAYYSLATDAIHLPLKEQYPTAARYYASALHELGHWTGAAARLGRNLGHPSGSEMYAREELRAEIASMMLGEEIGIGYDPGQHAAYVNSWIKVLEEDPQEIFRAAADASKIQDYILSFERRLKEAVETQVDEEILADLKRAHAEALPGYSSLESFQNLQSTAKEDGYAVVVERGGHAGLVVRYVDQHGELPPVHTELCIGDGKAKTFVRGEAMEGTRFTSELTWQRDALSLALGRFGGAMIQEGETKAAATGAVERRVSDEVTYLAVPFAEKDEAKRLGARWDKGAKCWYAPPGTDLNPLEHWLRGERIEYQSKSDPLEAFAEAMASHGLQVPAGHPRITGKDWVNVPLEGARPSKKAGGYRLNADGDFHYGCIRNHVTNETIPWHSNVRGLSSGQKAEVSRMMAEERLLHDKQIAEAQDEAAERVAERMRSLQPATGEVPYLKRKQVPAWPGAFTDGKRQTLYVPAYRIGEYEPRSMQTIPATPGAVKKFGKGEQGGGGVFHVVCGSTGRPADLAAVVELGLPIVVAEGPATAASLGKALGQPVVCAFQSGNLTPVASALRAQHPDALMIIAGDNDRKTELGPHKRNTGVLAANKAAEAVGGHTMFPNFAPGEPEEGLSDYNDLLVSSAVGRDKATADVRSQVASIRAKHDVVSRLRAGKEVAAPAPQVLTRSARR